MEEFLAEMADVRSEWQAGRLTRAEVEPLISVIAREWLVAQGWITPEMDEAIQAHLIALGYSATTVRSYSDGQGARRTPATDA